jgi:radical SAM-linked protein
MMETGARQRLRITFARGDEAKYVGHLDITRMWERLLRRAGLPVAYSSGQPPRVRLALAAPLAVGVTSVGELLDVLLDMRLPLSHLVTRLTQECPPGFSIVQVQQVDLRLPALQTEVRFGEYRVSLAGAGPASVVEERVEAVLAVDALPRQRHRDREGRSYDLRPQISRLWLDEWSGDGGVLGMVLQTDEKATGRPDEVAAALGLTEAVQSIQRVKLVLASQRP